MKDLMEDRTYALKSNPKLFDATLSEFAMKSFEAASLNEILKRSGFNKGSFYYRFTEKFDLYAALVGALFAAHAECLADDLLSARTKTGLRDSLAILVSSLQRLSAVDFRYLDLYALMSVESAALRSAVRDKAGMSPIESFLREVRQSADVLGERDDRIDLFTRLSDLVLNRVGSLRDDAGAWIVSATVADALIRAAFVPDAVPLFDRIRFPDRVRDVTNETEAMESGTEFALEAGEILAVVGAPLAGKSTLLRLIAGLGAPRDDNAPVAADPRRTIVFDGQRFPDSGIRMNRSPRRNLSVGRKQVDRDEVTALLELLGLTGVADVRLNRLGVSERVKTEFALVSPGEPALIVLDDAFKALGEDDKQRIYRLLLKWKHNRNTIVVSTSRMDEALSIADNILFIAGGKVLRKVPVAALKAKYGAKRIVVDYLDGGLERRLAFDAEAPGRSGILAALDTKTILDIKTEHITASDIYRMETGEESS